MNALDIFLENEHATTEQMIAAFDSVKEYGDVAVMKLDGGREKNHYTVFISFPANPQRDIMRAEKSDLISASKKVLEEYRIYIRSIK